MIEESEYQSWFKLVEVKDTETGKIFDGFQVVEMNSGNRVAIHDGSLEIGDISVCKRNYDKKVIYKDELQENGGERYKIIR